MIVTAIDPGPTESAYVIWDGVRVLSHGDMDNEALLSIINPACFNGFATDRLAIEQIRGFGVMASDKLFDTCWWSGRFFQAFGPSLTTMIPRKWAAAHICGQGGISKDQFVREALIARFGGKDVAIGNKKSPGPLYGITSHRWAALAVAITWMDQYAPRSISANPQVKHERG